MCAITSMKRKKRMKNKRSKCNAKCTIVNKENSNMRTGQEAYKQ